MSFNGVAYAQDADPAAAAPAPVAEQPADPAAAGDAPMAADDSAMVGAVSSPMGERTAPNSVFLDLGGPGFMYSINYERFLLQDVALRAGIMYFGIGASSGDSSASVSMMAIPILAEYTGVRAGNHALELGIGLDPLHFTATASSGGTFGGLSGWAMTGTAAIGYRYQDPAGGFLFRATFTPLFIFSPGEGGSAFIPWGGISFGYSF
jgi:hypothetical protein